MELLENAPTLIEAGRGRPLSYQIELLVQLLQALAYLHRRGIIHRDLKPDNVLVIEDQVKVLDFGLAVAREHLPKQNRDIYGTPAYLAPEVLEGEPVSEASDLYAVGVMAYELLAGQHPFNTTNLALLMVDALQTVPDTRVLAVEDQLRQILDRLLAKRPEARYATARELISTIAEATNRPDLAVETQIIRESYLQAAKFVGRKIELGQLVAALAAAKAGQGSAWLVGGESGVGKSRLLEELRTHALVEGALVLQGQAIDEGARPYRIWSEVLRRLCLESQLSDLEAGVCKTLIPDIGRLLDRAVPDAPEVGPQAAYERLLQVIGQIVRRQPGPVLIILEDLQWVGDESVAVLEHLANGISRTSLLLLASYRDDERAKLPQELPTVQHLALPRLTAENIAALSESMLGQAGRQPELINLLHQETEGNTFFIVEVMRTLAEEAGQLDQISSMSLPRTVFTGGIQTIVERRLQRVPPEAYPLLKVAAVAGRQLDDNLLRDLEPMINIELWLDRCAAASVLEVQEGRWRFVHDKLREGLVLQLTPDEQKGLHRQVAEAIEKVYAADLSSFYPRLAHHWRQAEINSKAIHYLRQAGDAAAGTYANTEAIAYYNQALQLAKYNEAGDQELADLYAGLGRALELASLYDQALTNYKEMEGLAQQHNNRPLELAALMSQATLYCTFTAVHDPALGQALSDQTLNLAHEIGDQAAEAKILWNLATLHRFSDRLPQAIDYSERSLALARRLNLREQMAFTLNGLAYSYWASGRFDQAQESLHEATALFRELGNLPMVADSLGAYTVIYTYAGQYDQAQAFSAEAFQISQSTSNLWGQSYSQAAVGYAYWERGRPDQAIAVMQDSIRRSELIDFPLPQVITRADLATVYGGLGDIEHGLETVQLALTIAETQLPLFRIKVLTVLAKLHVINNNLAEAEVVIAQGKKDPRRKAIPIFYVLLLIAEAELVLKQGDYERTMTLTDDLLTTLHQIGMRAYISEVLYLQGQALLALGRQVAARDRWVEARTIAEAIGSKQRLWPTSFALSRLEVNPTEAEHWLQQAREIVEYIAAHIGPSKLRDSFLALPQVRTVLDE
jgi:tetratricopeptide (TPR) repeat protein